MRRSSNLKTSVHAKLYFYTQQWSAAMSEKGTGIKRKRNRMDQPLQLATHEYSFDKDDKQLKMSSRMKSLPRQRNLTKQSSRDLSVSPFRAQKKPCVQWTRQQQLDLESESEQCSSENEDDQINEQAKVPREDHKDKALVTAKKKLCDVDVLLARWWELTNDPYIALYTVAKPADKNHHLLTWYWHLECSRVMVTAHQWTWRENQENQTPLISKLDPVRIT